MAKTIHLRRLLSLAVLLCLGLAGLGARLVVLQVIRHEKFKKIAEWNTQSYLLREPRRGDILDVNGNPLATSVPVKKVFANPRFIGGRYPEVARALAPLLSYNEGELARRLRPMIVRTNEQGKPVTNAVVNLKRKVSLEQWQQITQALAGISFSAPATSSRAQKLAERAFRQRAIYPLDDQQRIYPSERLAAHVLGFVQEDERETNNIIINDVEGRDGIEASFNRMLCGVRGWRVTEADNRRREIVVYREQEVEPRPGLNVVLTLDMIVQHIVESELAEAVKEHTPLSASALVVRPRTGEILAMATLPNYDPNQPNKAEQSEMRNRVIADTAEPGSTFKIVVVSGALNENVVTLSDTFDCEQGHWQFMGKPLRDDHGGHGPLTVEQIIAKSSNIGSAKIAIYKLGEQKLYDYIKAFGFGTKTGITLGGEAFGRVNNFTQADKLMISRVPMGQSVSVTHLQMVMAMCAIANDGKLMWPMLVNRLQDQNGSIFMQYHPRSVRQVISESAAKQIVQALKLVATKEGTAVKAALERYTVAGKTGTAQKVIDRVYAPGKYTTSFIGFFPADDPELCISVVLDEPKNGHYGGLIAAPVFRAIAEQVASYLKIHPDRLESGAETLAKGATTERLSTAALSRIDAVPARTDVNERQ